MSLKSSCIPHLARAIAEKKQLRASHGFSSLAVSPQHKVQVKPPLQRRASPIIRNIATSSIGSSRPLVPRRPPPPSRALEIEAEKLRKEQEQKEKQDAEKALKISQRQRRYLIYLSIFAVSVGTYALYTYQSYKLNVHAYNSSGHKLEQNANVMDRWHDAKRNFDHEVDSQERVMFMGYKRRRLIREAYGDVLEVSVGTGRNMMLYDTRPYDSTESASFGRDKRHMITSLTFNDQSPVMIERAQKKWKIEQKKRREDDRFVGEVNWITGDAGQSGVIPRPKGGYDTIIQTMGVCSMPRPVEFLRHLGRLVRQPGEEIVNTSPERQRKQMDDGQGGRIFLLEHGRARDQWPLNLLNKYLDTSAAMHADRYGCWFNKDIGEVIQHTGLVVERVRRYHFGTTWEIVLRPAPGPLPGEEVKIDSVPAPLSQSSQKSWWSDLWR